ncbi:MAG: hypothetical protein WD492_06525 [Alkalispirochaeta sp.]
MAHMILGPDTDRLLRLLREDGLAIGLNVHAENHAAVKAYRAVGFVHAAHYVEMPLQRT